MIPHLHLAWPQERLGWSLHGHKAWAPALGTLCPLMRYWTGEGLSVLQPAHLQHLSQTLALGRQSLARRERVHCSCKRGAHVWQGGVNRSLSLCRITKPRRQVSTVSCLQRGSPQLLPTRSPCSKRGQRATTSRLPRCCSSSKAVRPQGAPSLLSCRRGSPPRPRQRALQSRR